MQNTKTTNTDCALYDTDYCAIMGRGDCELCALKDASSSEQESAKHDIDLVRSLLPDGSLDELTNCTDCQLCAGEHPNKAEYYAISDFGHPEPKGTKVSAIGIKVKTRIGSMIPLQIPCCAKCRKNHMIVNYLPVIVLVLTLLVGLLIMSIPAVARVLTGINEIAPLGVFLLFIPAGWALGYFITQRFIASAEKQTRFNVVQIAFVKRLMERGWFPVTNNNKAESRLLFSKEKLKRGWFI